MLVCVSAMGRCYLLTLFQVLKYSNNGSVLQSSRLISRECPGDRERKTFITFELCGQGTGLLPAVKAFETSDSGHFGVSRLSGVFGLFG